jgi:Xaa-Pro aminopeptidase
VPAHVIGQFRRAASSNRGKTTGYDMTPEAHRVPSAEIRQRCCALQERLRAEGIEGALILQRADLYYFSGTAQNGLLYVPAEGSPLLLIKRHFPRARQESSLEHIHSIASIKETPRHIPGRAPSVLGLEADVLPMRDYNFIGSLFPKSRLVDVSSIILALRGIKSPWEMSQLAAAAELSAQTFAYMREIIRPGLSEIEFAGMYETFARRLGHGGSLRTRHFLAEAYPWHVLSGENGGKVGMLDAPFSGEGTSPAFPCGAGHRRLQPDEPILVDFGVALNGYHTDETRMFCIGSMPAKAMDVCRAAIEIHNGLAAAIKPGLTAGELFEKALLLARSLNVDEAFLGPPGSKVRFVGHGIGLELVEPPYIAAGKRDPLQPGMVLALEPKFCFAGEFAAGVESVVAVGDKGARLVSRVPVDVFQCSG